MSGTPSVGRIVHYVSFGTPGGEYPSACRAAVVTGAVTSDAGVDRPVSLCVLNPEGLFFSKDVAHSEDDHRGGTWHWPERVG